MTIKKKPKNNFGATPNAASDREFENWGESLLQQVQTLNTNNDGAVAPVVNNKLSDEILPTREEFGTPEESVNTAHFFITCMRASLWSFILGFLYYIGIIFVYRPWGNELTDDNIFTTDDLDTHASLRGQISSGVSVLVVNGIGAILNSSPTFREKHSSLYTVNLGFIFSNIFGFFLDKIYGTAEGNKILFDAHSDTDKNPLQYIIETFSRKSFFRFMVTVLLDMFISEPLQDALKYTISISGAKNILQAINTSQKLPVPEFDENPEQAAIQKEDFKKRARNLFIDELLKTNDKFKDRTEANKIADYYDKYIGTPSEVNFSLTTFIPPLKKHSGTIDTAIAAISTIAIIALSINTSKNLSNQNIQNKETWKAGIMSGTILWLGGRLLWDSIGFFSFLKWFKNPIDGEARKPDNNTTFGYFDKLLAENFDSLLQSIVALITFFAYTNQTRFLWAYPGPTTKRIDNIVIQLALAISLAIYFSFAINSPINGKYAVRQASTKTQRFIFFIIGIALCSAIGNNMITPPKQLIYTPNKNTIIKTTNKIQDNYSFWKPKDTKKLLKKNHADEIFSGRANNITIEKDKISTATPITTEINILSANIPNNTPITGHFPLLTGVADSLVGDHHISIRGIKNKEIGKIISLYTVTDTNDELHLVIHTSFTDIFDAINFRGFKAVDTTDLPEPVQRDNNLFISQTIRDSSATNDQVIVPIPNSRLFIYNIKDLTNIPAIIAGDNWTLYVKDDLETNTKDSTEEYKEHLDNLDSSNDDIKIKYYSEYLSFIKKWEEKNRHSFYSYTKKLAISPTNNNAELRESATPTIDINDDILLKTEYSDMDGDISSGSVSVPEPTIAETIPETKKNHIVRAIHDFLHTITWNTESRKGKKELKDVLAILKEVKEERREKIKELVELGPLVIQHEKDEMLFAGENKSLGIIFLSIIIHLMIYLAFIRKHERFNHRFIHIILQVIIFGILTKTIGSDEKEHSGIEAVISCCVLFGVGSFCLLQPILAYRASVAEDRRLAVAMTSDYEGPLGPVGPVGRDGFSSINDQEEIVHFEAPAPNVRNRSSPLREPSGDEFEEDMEFGKKRRKKNKK